jgi:acetyltransferase-like isoleucine patch superfamily enzyme
VRSWQQYLYYSIDRMRAWRGYARAKLWALQGAKLGRRVIIEADCRIDRPWGVTIGERSRLERRVWLKLVSDAARTEIGSFCFLGTGTELNVINSIEIGDHTVIAPGCFITDHDHGTLADRGIDEQPCVTAPVRIGSDVWIGAGVCILRGVTIGDGAVIGAGAVVKRDVSAYDVAAGIPTKIIRNRASRLGA